MRIILSKLVGPRRTGTLEWRFHNRTWKSATVRFELRFLPKMREFTCIMQHRDSRERPWSGWRPATIEETDHLRSRLDATAIAACTAAAIRATVRVAE